MEEKKIKGVERQLIIESYIDSHKEFMKRHANLLWLYEEFFIRNLFKRNKNINPTKMSHSGMNPEYLQLTKKECEELLESALIEPSDS